jgi:hypothetical protein
MNPADFVSVVNGDFGAFFGADRTANDEGREEAFAERI